MSEPTIPPRASSTRKNISLSCAAKSTANNTPRVAPSIGFHKRAEPLRGLTSESGLPTRLPRRPERRLGLVEADRAVPPLAANAAKATYALRPFRRGAWQNNFHTEGSRALLACLTPWRPRGPAVHRARTFAKLAGGTGMRLDVRRRPSWRLQVPLCIAAVLGRERNLRDGLSRTVIYG